MTEQPEKRRFTSYDEAMAFVEERLARGDNNSKEYLRAVASATEFFLKENGGRYFNETNEETFPHPEKKCKFITIKDLHLKATSKIGDFGDDRVLMVDRPIVCGHKDLGDELG